MNTTLAPASPEQPALLEIFRKEKRLTDCLEILAQSGFHGDTAIFLLSYIGGGK